MQINIIFKMYNFGLFWIKIAVDILNIKFFHHVVGLLYIDYCVNWRYWLSSLKQISKPMVIFSRSFSIS